MKDLLFKLCGLDGVSGSEGNVADYCAQYLSKYCKVTKDYHNNVIAILGNKNAEKTILLDAHIDQIGFIVTEIDNNGFVKVDKCGGIDYRTLLGSPVKVYGKNVLDGVICCMPPHLIDGKEDTAVSADMVWIDLGLPAHIVQENISIGDNAVLIAKPSMLLNNRITAPALDNRAGVAAILKACELLSKRDLFCKVVILLSCQEETYGTGAKTKAFEYIPDEAICVDVSFSNQEGVSGSYSNIQLGKGPMLCYSSTLNKNMTNKFKDIAGYLNISTQIEVCGGRTGTNADSITVTKSGVKSTVLSIPQRNMHTQTEIVDIKDVENTAKLIAEYVISGGV